MICLDQQTLVAHGLIRVIRAVDSVLQDLHLELHVVGFVVAVVVVVVAAA